MNESKLRELGIQYENAWRRLIPEEVFSFQAKNCVTSINDGNLMISAEERLDGIIGFMEAFPNLLITMRETVEEERGTVFYWNLKGTNTGQGGTGNRIDIDGCDVWKLDNDNKITELNIYFDAEEYERQVNKREFKISTMWIIGLIIPPKGPRRVISIIVGLILLFLLYPAIMSIVLQ